eukprot:TRINITY_DN4521_c1_g1_i4.p1 TRINITY_DN4521_c1_g1~~TRINITY_DN4521_c1_g1_i4.p1  ORF type:complete len:882 (+),score=250.45 TRINITY_DN4521_c1_g1_i4:113-2647(+)
MPIAERVSLLHRKPGSDAAALRVRSSLVDDHQADWLARLTPPPPAGAAATAAAAQTALPVILASAKAAARGLQSDTSSTGAALLGSPSRDLSPPRTVPASRMTEDWAALAAEPAGARESGGLGGPGSSGLYPRRIRRAMLKSAAARVGALSAHAAGAPALPYRVDDGVAAAAGHCGLRSLVERELLSSSECADVSLSEAAVRALFHAKCADTGTEVGWGRFTRFADIVVRRCHGPRFLLTDSGMASQCAKVIAQALQSNETYTILDLSRNTIRDEGAIALAGLLSENSSLVRVVLKSNGIGASGAEALAESLVVANRTVTSLDMSGSGGGSRNLIGPRGAGALAAALKTNHVLAVISVACCGIGTRGTRLLAEGIAVNRSLQELDASRNAITSDGAAVLGAAFARSPALLRILKMRGNRIRDKGVHALASNLRPTVEELDLGETGCGAAGLHSLASMLRHTSALRELLVDGNLLTRAERNVDGYTLPVLALDGMVALADALRDSRELASLSLRSCRIPSDAAHLVLACLQSPGLTSLSIGGNPFGPQAAAEILNAVSGNTRLKFLDISDVALQKGSDVGVRALAHMVRTNKQLQVLHCRQHSVVPDARLLSAAFHDNRTLTKLDSSARELEQPLRRNLDRWKRGRGARLVAQLESKRTVEGELQEKLLLIRGVDKELEKQQSSRFARRQDQTALLRSLRADVAAKEVERLASAEVLAAEKIETEKMEEDTRRQWTLCDDVRARHTRRREHDQVKAKELEQAAAKVEKRRAKVAEAMAEEGAAMLAELAEAEAARAGEEAKAMALASALVAKELQLKQAEAKAAVRRDDPKLARRRSPPAQRRRS